MDEKELKFSEMRKKLALAKTGIVRDLDSLRDRLTDLFDTLCEEEGEEISYRELYSQQNRADIEIYRKIYRKGDDCFVDSIKTISVDADVLGNFFILQCNFAIFELMNYLAESFEFIYGIPGMGYKFGFTNQKRTIYLPKVDWEEYLDDYMDDDMDKIVVETGESTVIGVTMDLAKTDPFTAFSTMLIVLFANDISILTDEISSDPHLFREDLLHLLHPANFSNYTRYPTVAKLFIEILHFLYKIYYDDGNFYTKWKPMFNELYDFLADEILEARQAIFECH